MAIWIPVAIGAGLIAYICQDRTRDFLPDELYASRNKMMLTKDNREYGMSWAIQKVGDLNITNLNRAHQPYSAPSQEPTYDMGKIMANDADRSTFVSLYNPNFFFRHNTEIPLTTAACHTTNVEIPSLQSFLGDPGSSLAKLPRTYIDKPPFTRNDLFAEEYGATGAMGAGQSDVWEPLYVPETGQLNYNFFPYGPGGAYQNLTNTLEEQITRERGANRSTLIGPPIFSSVL